jgi:hypothetical protein
MPSVFVCQTLFAVGKLKECHVYSTFLYVNGKAAGRSQTNCGGTVPDGAEFGNLPFSEMYSYVASETVWASPTS